MENQCSVKKCNERNATESDWICPKHQQQFLKKLMPRRFNQVILEMVENSKPTTPKEVRSVLEKVKGSRKLKRKVRKNGRRIKR